MSKVLVIKGANFSTNKVATIEFDRIHTTDIELDDSTATLSSLGATKTLGYTLVPSDSEDPVEWTSSNTSVCTVSNEGVVTAVGCGTAIITATSNGHSDTCTVTNEIVMTGYVKAPKTYLAPQNSSGHATTMDTYIGLSNTGYDIYMVMIDTDSTKQRLNASNNFAALDSETNKYYIPDVPTLPNATRVLTNIGYTVPIILPANCTSVKLVALNEHYAPCTIWMKSNTRTTESDENENYFNAYSKAIATPNNYSWSYKKETTLSMESGYDSIGVIWKADTANGATSFANLTEEQLAEFKLICL